MYRCRIFRAYEVNLFVIKMKLVQTLRLKSSSMSTAKTMARLRTYAKQLSFC